MMDITGIENLVGKLTFPELLVKHVAEQIINEQILSNGKFYLILIVLLFLTSASTSFLASYFRKKGENFATKADFQNLLNQIEAQIKITEEVKTVISHKDWATKEWKTLRRIKLEELMSSVYDFYPWEQKVRAERFWRGDENSTPNPLNKTRMIAILYFPELAEEIDLFSKSVSDFEIWSCEMHIKLISAKDDHEETIHILQHLKETSNEHVISIRKAINSIELKAYQIMADITRIEPHKNYSPKH